MLSLRRDAMASLRRYAGGKTLLFGWTTLILVCVVVGSLEFRSLPSAVATTRLRVGLVVVGIWIVGVGLLRYRERRGWREMASGGQFDPQSREGGTYPSLQSTVRGRTVTVTADVTGVFSEVRASIRTTVDGVERPVDITLRYLGSGGRDEGLPFENPTLDDAFVAEAGTPDLLAPLLTPDVQSTLMDLDVSGVLHVDDRRVVYDVPTARLSPGDLRRCANVVATVGTSVEQFGPRT